MSDEASEGPSEKDWDLAHEFNRMWEQGKKAGQRIDAKTGLPLIDSFEKDALRLVEEVKRLPEEELSKIAWSVVFLDGNDFREINKVLSNIDGDDFIKGEAESIKKSLRAVDFLYRNSEGADEVVGLIRHFPKDEFGGNLIGGFESSILRRIVKGNEEFRKDFFEKPDRKKKAAMKGRDLLAEGVGSLAIGVEYFSGKEIKILAEKWEKLTDEEKAEKSFVNRYLLPNADEAQSEAKVIAKEERKTVAMALELGGKFRRIDLQASLGQAE